jgi:hypothetical protein
MDNGMNSIQNYSASAKNKTRKLKGCLLWFLIVAIVYVLLTLWAQWTPPVRGIVVDAETGKPIEGVEIIRQGQGGTIAPTEKEYSWTSCPNNTTTSKDGTFNIPGTLKSGLKGEIQLTPTVWIDELALYADHREYVCSNSPYGKTHPAMVDAKKPYKPTINGWEEARSPYGYAFYERRRLWFFRGYEYRIRINKADTEEEWRAKCECAMNANFKFMQSEPTDKWLFDDLVGYLERFPDGEKAGRYLIKAINVSLLRYEEKEAPTYEGMLVFSNEARLLLDLATKIPIPSEPWGLRVGYEQNINALSRELFKAEQYLEKEK